MAEEYEDEDMEEEDMEEELEKDVNTPKYKELEDENKGISEQYKSIKSEEPEDEEEAEILKDKYQENIGYIRDKEIKNKVADVQQRKYAEEERRQLEKIKQLQKGPSTTSLMSSQLAGYFGFTREGVVGSQIAKQKLQNQTTKVQQTNELISTLNKQKNLKIKQAQSDGIITKKEKDDINALIDKISGYEKQADVQRDILNKLKTERLQESRYNYISPSVMKKISLTSKNTLKGKRGKKTGKTIKLKNKKAPVSLLRYETPSERSLKSLMKEPKQQQTKEMTEEELQAQTKMQMQQKPKNRYGVEDWIMNL